MLNYVFFFLLKSIVTQIWVFIVIKELPFVENISRLLWRRGASSKGREWRQPWAAPSCRQSCVPPSCSSAPLWTGPGGGSTWRPGWRRSSADLWSDCGETGPGLCSRSPVRYALTTDAGTKRRVNKNPLVIKAAWKRKNNREKRARKSPARFEFVTSTGSIPDILLRWDVFLLRSFSLLLHIFQHSL